MTCQGAGVNAQDDDFLTPLHALAKADADLGEKCHPKTYSLLLDAGADVNLKTKHGKTALDYIKRLDNEEILCMALKKSSQE